MSLLHISVMIPPPFHLFQENGKSHYAERQQEFKCEAL